MARAFQVKQKTFLLVSRVLLFKENSEKYGVVGMIVAYIRGQEGKSEKMRKVLSDYSGNLS